MSPMTTGMSPATRFLVDGQEFGGGLATFSFDRLAIAAFTADPTAVGRLLPSSLLHPVRWFNGRCVVAVAGEDIVMTIGELPPVRFANILVTAMVTFGRSPAMPVLPLAGALLPLVGGAVDRRYRMATCDLVDVATNRVAAEVYRLLFGNPVRVAAIREDRDPDRLRFTATDPSDGQILSLEISSGGRATPIDQPGHAYFVSGSQLVRLSMPSSGSQAVRLGRSAARLHLGQHPLADQLRDIGLSPRPLMTIVRRSFSEAVDRPPERLAPVETAPLEPTPADPVVAPMVIGHEDGHEETVDQLLDGLPFDAAGMFQPTGA